MLKIEEQFRNQVENQKIKCKDEIEEWTKYADEKLLNICHSMQDTTSENQENVQGMS